MENNKRYNNAGEPSQQKHTTVETISIDELRRIVHLLDNSDVSEIELKQESDGRRLVLRKAKKQGDAGTAGSVAFEAGEVTTTTTGSLVAVGNADTGNAAETKHTVIAPLVGIFHSWGKPNGKPLVAVGDRIKVGQLVGTIQSLNVLNEVESTVAGRVAEIFVRDGQPVEYGQQLLAIDSAEGA